MRTAMRKAQRKKGAVCCPDCRMWYMNRRKAKCPPCPPCQELRDRVHAVHYQYGAPLTPDQEIEERERRMTCRVADH